MIDYNIYKLKVAKIVFGESDNELIKSFMNQIESHLIDRNGKSVIASSKILDIMLLDYHKSRQLNVNKDHKMFINNNPEMFDNEVARKGEGIESDKSKESKINYFKQLTFDYIKERELDR